MRLTSIIPALAVLLLAAVACPATWHVPSQCPTIQAGIDSASAGDTVLVACGTYYEHDIVIKSGTCLRSETGEAECVTIDGEGLGRVMCCADASRGTIVEGLTVTNGLADGAPSSWGDCGAGLYLESSSPKLTHCVFRSNRAVDRGAGVYFSFGSQPRIDNCSFVTNLARIGAGLDCGGAPWAEIRDCSFLGNHAEHGAGVHFGGGSSPLITGCTFVDNTAWRGGGLACGAGSEPETSYPTIINCSFQNNAASSEAGPDVYARGGGLYMSGFVCPTMSDCKVSGNSASYQGGGVYMRISSGSFTDCVFSDNSSDWHGGGMYCTYYSSPILTGCIFSGNSAGNQGGGLELPGPCTASLIRCIFYGNSAHYGGAMRCEYCSEPTVTHCTFFGNWAWFGGGIYCIDRSAPVLENTIMAFGTRGEAVYCWDTTCAPALDCCDVHANANGDWVGCIADQYGINGNISADPLFCDPDNGNFYLQCSSPCAAFTSPNPQCDLIGAWPVGCGGTAVEGTSWSSLKALYR
jgi:hypothetical protein